MLALDVKKGRFIVYEHNVRKYTTKCFSVQLPHSITRGALESKESSVILYFQRFHRDEFICPKKDLNSFTSYIQSLEETKFSRYRNQCTKESI